jgi:hypothetical protein
MLAPFPGQNLPTGDNSAVIASLVQRRRRARAWLIGFLVLMPVGCVGPFSLFSVAPKSMQTPLFIAALALPLVGLAGAILMLGDRSKYRRALALAEEGQALGLRLVEKPAKPEHERLQSLRLFGHADTHVGGWNLLGGPVEGVRAAALDYAFVLGAGQGKKTVEQTVFLLNGAASGVPNFIAYPRSWRDSVSRVLGQRYAEVPGQPAFNQQFAVPGEDGAALTRFTPEAVQLLLEQKDFAVEAQHGVLAACRYGKYADAGDYGPIFQWMTRLAEALRGPSKP